MKLLKLNLATIISIISALCYSYVSFLGLYFYWLGDILKSLVGAVAVSIVLGVIVIFLRMIKAAKRNFHKNAIIEILVLAFYFIAAIILFNFPYSHYYTVYDKKNEIIKKVDSVTSSTIKMFDEYELYVNNRIFLYDAILTRVINGKKTNYKDYLANGFLDNGENDLIQKNRLIIILKDDLLPAKYDSSKKFVVKWLQYVRISITEWKPIGLMRAIKGYDIEVEKCMTVLNSYYIKVEKRPLTELFNPNILYAKIEEEFTQTGSPTIMGICSAIVLNILFLFPYFFAYRSKRHRGFINEIIKNKNNEPSNGIFDI
jgi:hypothetical protein